MNILYTDIKRRSLTQHWRIEHDIVVSSKNINRRLVPAVDKMYIDIMLGAKYNGRPFDYFRDMLIEYIKR